MFTIPDGAMKVVLFECKTHLTNLHLTVVKNPSWFMQNYGLADVDWFHVLQRNQPNRWHSLMFQRNLYRFNTKALLCPRIERLLINVWRVQPRVFAHSGPCYIFSIVLKSKHLPLYHRWPAFEVDYTYGTVVHLTNGRAADKLSQLLCKRARFYVDFIN